MEEVKTLAGTSRPICSQGKTDLRGKLHAGKCAARAVAGSIYCKSHRDAALGRVAQGRAG